MIARSYRLEIYNSTKVEIYELRTGQLVVPEIELPAGVGTVTALAFTPDGRMLSFGDGTGQIGNIELSDGSVEADVYRGATGSVLYLSYTAERPEHLLGLLGSTSAVWWDTSSRWRPSERPSRARPARLISALLTRRLSGRPRTWRCDTWSCRSMAGCACGTSTSNRGPTWPVNVRGAI